MTKHFYDVYSILITWSSVPEAIRNPVAIKYPVSDLYIKHVLYLNLFSSVLVICHGNTHLTQTGVMHEAGYVYYIWRTFYHFPYGYFTYVHLLIYGSPLSQCTWMFVTSRCVRDTVLSALIFDRSIVFICGHFGTTATFQCVYRAIMSAVISIVPLCPYVYNLERLQRSIVSTVPLCPQCSYRSIVSACNRCSTDIFRTTPSRERAVTKHPRICEIINKIPHW